MGGGRKMNAERMWDNIFARLNETPEDVSTVPSNKRAPLWFFAYIENGRLYIQNSINYEPSTKMSQRREISKNNFIPVYSYYHRWANGERNLRQEVRTISRNTAYIFALISKYE